MRRCQSSASTRKALIHLRAHPRRRVEGVQLGTLSWVHWWNTKRLLEPIGDIPPVELEEQWLATQRASQTDNDDDLAGAVA